MSPRQRAEALGWETDGLDWWDANGGWVCGWHGVTWRWRMRVVGEWAHFVMADDALAHALLLRDVVLS